jgi:hypothetical protein
MEVFRRVSVSSFYDKIGLTNKNGNKNLHIVERCLISLLLSLKFRPQMVTGIQHLQIPISSLMA